MDKSKIVLGCLGGALLLILVALVVRPKDPACEKLQANVELAKAFCGGLAERAAHERCQSVSDEPDTLGQCLRVMRPAAMSSCMDYLNLKKMKEDLEALCS